MLIRIGTRASKLALWQAHHVAQLLESIDASLKIQIVPIKTTGDLILDRSLAKVGGKGLFLKEIEDALLRDDVDIAVHSMKDVPAQMPEGLVIAAMLEREDSRDAWVSNDGISFDMLPSGKKVGSSSLRRVCQLKRLRPDLDYVDVRGNVDTRLKKMQDGEYAAIVLATAGLKRLGLSNVVTQHLDIVSSVGQGAIGIECLESRQDLKSLVAPLNHSSTYSCVNAERAFLAVLGGGCEVPVGCHATLSDSTLTIRALISDIEGKNFIEEKTTCLESEGVSNARDLAHKMLDGGGRNLLI